MQELTQAMQEFTPAGMALLCILGTLLGLVTALVIWLLLSPIFIYLKLRRANRLSEEILEQLELLNQRGG